MNLTIAKNKLAGFLAVFLVLGTMLSFSSVALADENNNDEEGNFCIDLNTADKDALLEITNVDEDVADAIIEYRGNSEFESVSDLINVVGLDQDEVDEIIAEDRACVKGSETSDEETDTNSDDGSGVDTDANSDDESDGNNNNDDGNENEKDSEGNDEEKEELVVPDTNTNMYNYILGGAVLLVVGLIGMFFYRKKSAQE